MATTTDHALLEAMVTLIWACLLVPNVGKNSLFALLFFDKSVVFDIALSASLSFCPGLLEATQAAAPPTLSWWKSLPSDYLGRWGVYALVFEKRGSQPYIYTGEASECRYGVAPRWALYDKHNIYLRDNTEGLPSQVIWAFKQGYKITHKGLLVSAPIPSAANLPAFRLLFYAMEATFSFLFWTMKSTTKDYGMASCCPWYHQKGLFTYGGLCSHSALHDPIHGNFGLTAEELIALDAARQAATRADKIRRYELLKIEDPENLKATRKRAEDKYMNNPHGKHKAKLERRKEKVKAEHPYYCDVCDVDCEKPNHLERHNKTPRHLKELADLKAGIVKRYRCEPCKKKFPYPSCIVKHNRCARHKANMAKLTASPSNTA